METTTVPLDQLRLSPSNVRKTMSGIDDLAASIAAHGLLQNLTVTPTDAGFDVVAGGRRLRALQVLAERGTIGSDHPTPCIIVTETNAAEVSTAENVVRAAMHPADEFEAFNALASSGLNTHQIADRFGCDELHVRQRLRLANVAPAIIADYRAGKANLEQLMALAVTDDHDAQQRVWSGRRLAPSHIREQLTIKEYDIERHPVARFVGIEAYTKAGGRINQDLFGGPGAGFMIDTDIADRLATAKLQKRADTLIANGWSWAEPHIRFDYEKQRKFGQEYGDWRNGKEVYSDDVKAYAGAVVTISEYNGKIKIIDGLVRPGDKPAAAEAAKTRNTPDAKVAKEAKARAGGLPFVQVQRLQGVRTAALRLHLLDNQHAALAALAADLYRAALASPNARRRDPGHRIVHIAPIRDYIARPDRPAAEAIEQHPAHAETMSRVTALRERIESQATGSKLLPWLLTQPLQMSLDILTACAADNLFAAEKNKAGTDPGQAFASALGVDLAEHWQPTAEWLASIPRAVVLTAVAEACGAAGSARVERLRGDELAQTAAELLAGTRWLPPTLRDIADIAPGKPKPKPKAKKVERKAGGARVVA